MVYHLAGGNTDYDPTLKGLPSNAFVGMDSSFTDVAVADTTADGGTRIMKSSWHVGRPVSPETVPTKVRRTGPPVSRAKLLDVNSQTGALDLVSQTFRDIVEEFEPAIHQFFPVTSYDSRGKEVIGEGYFMIICQRLSTLHDTLCVPPLDESGMYNRFSETHKDRDKSLDRVVFSKEKIGDHHMWHDKFLARHFLFSNALTERLFAANLTGLVSSKYEEV
ncbi:DUF1629 domain-containing protein [Pseudosulfitobacter sp. DSM 107133]|uniref:imm11 family protein n=1 Tax=Pseudosulfitobacter sp. DSM 107133 TaxID=2883100 RepID=UPI000DF40A9F|nr:DUF1629 domain-containing protein [Pseudosulfitobacter sp. DSM 107133]UOA28617.1 hypothetical protein DSM107133_03367 [Pseudosulfitobacter sp. DSM 107133]